MTRLNLSFACLPYDRIQPIFSGEVPVDGANVIPISLRWPLEVFSRMLAHQEFDVAEMSITHAIVYTALKKAEFVLLPVFPSRMFRHGFVFINKNSGIASPKDLAGRRIGSQGYQATAPVWIRGILRSEYGVDLDRVTWVEGGVNQRGLQGGSSTSMRPSKTIAAERIGDDRTLSEMLASGEIAALINPEIPNSLRTSADVARLFPDYHALERDYYSRTRIYPIMHVLVLRRSLYEQHPWLATSLYKACQAAKTLALRQARFSGALAYMLPWLYEHLEEVAEVFGDDPWPYGLTPNRPTLEAFVKILVDEGFLPAPMALEELFVPVEESIR